MAIASSFKTDGKAILPSGIIFRMWQNDAIRGRSLCFSRPEKGIGTGAVIIESLYENSVVVYGINNSFYIVCVAFEFAQKPTIFSAGARRVPSGETCLAEKKRTSLRCRNRLLKWLRASRKQFPVNFKAVKNATF